jgi:asparagine synthase (glutamine-hydrolysing)
VLVEQFDEPFGDSSAIPMLYLARMTRRYVKVALSGDGADEIFGGYRRYYWGVCEERLRAMFPDWFRRTVIRFGARHYPAFEYMPRIFRAKSTLNFLANELGDAYFTHMSVFRDTDGGDYLSPDMKLQLGGYSPREHFRDRFASRRHLAPLQQMQAVDLETYLPGDILVKVDRATMAFSVEGRCPWLDYRLAELSRGLPANLNLRGSINKYAFKKAMAPYVPEELIVRPKMGFAVPLASWFRTALKPIFENLVFQPEMERYLALGAVRKLWLQHQAKTHNHDRKLWNFLMLAAWDATHLNRRHAQVDTALAEGKAAAVAL